MLLCRVRISAYAKEPLMENAALFRMIIERGFNQGDVSVLRGLRCKAY